jgi:hypothetical protein
MVIVTFKTLTFKKNYGRLGPHCGKQPLLNFEIARRNATSFI